MTRFRVLRALLLTIAVIVGLGLLGALALRIYGAHRLAKASERYEREVGSLSLDDFVRPKISVEHNAVTWLRPGVLAAVFFPGETDLIGSLSAKSFSAWTPDDAAELETILLRNRPSIELLDRARGMKSSNWDIPYEKGSTAKIPDLLAAIRAARLLNARGRLALGRGDRETALLSVEALGALARSHETESATIMVLIGIAIEKYHLALVHELATSALTTPAELDRLDASLCGENLTDAVRRSLRSNAAAVVHDLDAHSALEGFDGAIPRKLEGVLAHLVAAAVIEGHLAAEKHLGAPIKVPFVDAGEEYREAGWFKHLTLVYGTNSASASARACAIASARDLARLAIALRREAFATGRYPPSLPAIDGVPSDDPLTGGPRAYDVRADGSAEIRTSTTVEIFRSITPGGQLFFDALYRWTLPAPH